MCPDCNHETHDAGQCKSCNCGESSRSVSMWDRIPPTSEGNDLIRIPCRQMEVGGADERDPDVRIKSSFYTRRGLPRRRFIER